MKLVLFAALFTGFVFASEYQVMGDVRSLFWKDNNSLRKLGSQLNDEFKDFVQTCDPTDGEEKDMHEGCKKAYRRFSTDLQKSSYDHYRFNGARVRSDEVVYDFRRDFRITDSYGCQLAAELFVTKANVLKATNFDMYCD